MLYVVGTPIGNLGDMTFRAVETLKSVDLIACEDTRQTAKLLHYYQIAKPLISVHDHNERQRAPELIDRLKSGKSAALVSDGGTPLINDPGWWLVHCVIEEGLPVSWIPGPVAAIGALVLSGLPTDRFIFEGFLPAKSGARRRRLETLRDEERTIVFYESPHRLLKTLEDIRDILGDVPVACARELTKVFEQTIRGTISEAVQHFSKYSPRGECVLVVHR